MLQWIKAIIILPFNVLVIIPSIILYLNSYSYSYSGRFHLGIGILFLLVGLFFAGWTMLLFDRIGKGTAAPWAPPKNLVIRGPYKFVRNPMITAVFSILISEYFLLNTSLVLYWLGAFILINMIYIPFVEEKKLEKLFGQDYLEYKRNVPRWIPRFSPWDKDS